MCKNDVRIPIYALVLLSMGGLLLHLRIHPPGVETLNYVPLFVGLFATVLLPFLFACSKTVRVAYILNILVVAAGTIGMAYYSISNWGAMPLTARAIVLDSTFADILILLARLPIGHVILKQTAICETAQG